MTLRTLEDGSKEAVIEFQTDAAAKTALLLTNALIVDRPITVAPLESSEQQQSDNPVSHETTVSGDAIQNQEYPVPDQERTKTSVIASMIAAGYNMGADAIEKARAYDEQYGITTIIQAQAESLKAKAQQLNQQYKIGETASAWSNTAYGWWSGVDQSLGLSQTATALRESSAAAAKAISESEAAQAAGEALEITKGTLVEAAGAIKTGASRLIEEQPTLNAASKEVQDVVQETSRLIQERDRQARATRSSSSSSTTTQPSPSPSTETSDPPSVSTDSPSDV